MKRFLPLAAAATLTLALAAPTAMANEKLELPIGAATQTQEYAAPVETSCSFLKAANESACDQREVQNPVNYPSVPVFPHFGI